MICRHVIIPMGGHFHRICPQIHDRTFIAKIRYSRASSAAPCHFIITTFDCIPTTFDCIPPLLWTFYVTFCWITKSLLLFPMCICVYLCESIICTCIHIFCTDVVCLLHLQYLSKNTRMSFLHLGKENSVTSCLCFNAFCSVLWGESLSRQHEHIISKLPITPAFLQEIFAWGWTILSYFVEEMSEPGVRLHFVSVLAMYYSF